jgi:hypothetical protein
MTSQCCSDLPDCQIEESLRAVLRYSEQQNFAGYCKFDALNSPLLWQLVGGQPLLRLIISFAINRSWINMRPLLRVPKLRNPKGIANFLRAYVNLFNHRHETRDLAQAVDLGEWLLKNDSCTQGTFSGRCWGYHFPWQSAAFYAPRHFPNCIVTVFAAEALLLLFQTTRESRYLEAAKSAAQFLITDLPVLEEDAHSKCIGYIPGRPKWKVININAVTAGYLARLWLETKQEHLLLNAQKLISWVVNHRTAEYAWEYTVPGSASGIGVDNYHTGGILDGLLDYMSITNDWQHREIFDTAVGFYENRLFAPSGAPYLTSTKKRPFDIHGSAQGIITFSKLARLRKSALPTALRIAHWALTNMQDQDGHFYTRKHLGYTQKECLMRWNNSWMSLALSELLGSLAQQPSKP